MPDTHDDPIQQVTASLREALAVAVGLGVLAVNRVQAVRRQVSGRDASPDDGEKPPTS